MSFLTTIFQFHLHEILGDCLIRIKDDCVTSCEELSEYLDEVEYDMMQSGWQEYSPNVIGCITDLYYEIWEPMHRFVSPLGQMYYELERQLDDTTFLLTKRAFE